MLVLRRSGRQLLTTTRGNNYSDDELPNEVMEDSKRGETEQPTLMDTSTADNGAGSSAQESSGSNVNRVVLSRDELGSVGADRLRQLWWEQDRYLDQLEMRLHEATAAAESNKARADAGKREQLLVMRLSTKEQELQELAAQIAELKSAQAPSTGQLKATLVDPGVNLIIQKLKVRDRLCLTIICLANMS